MTSTSSLLRRPRRHVGALGLALAAALATGACDDAFTFDPDIRIDTVTVFSLAVPRLNLPSAFSFSAQTLGPQVLETTGPDSWDVAFDTQDGTLTVTPPGAFGLVSRARITELPGSPVFETVEEAPRDTIVYTASDALPLRTDAVYVVRTHEEAGLFFGARCVYFAKFQPLRLDVAEGEIDFVYQTNLNCNDRRLVPID